MIRASQRETNRAGYSIYLRRTELGTNKGPKLLAVTTLTSHGLSERGREDRNREAATSAGAGENAAWEREGRRNRRRKAA